MRRTALPDLTTLRPTNALPSHVMGHLAGALGTPPDPPWPSRPPPPLRLPPDALMPIAVLRLLAMLRKTKCRLDGPRIRSGVLTGDDVVMGLGPRKKGWVENR